MARRSSTPLLILAAGILFGAAGAATPAYAMTQPPPVKLNGGPLGQLEVSGGISGFFYAYSGAGEHSVYGNGKSAGAESFVNMIHVTKPTGRVRFTIEAKVYDSVYMGIHPSAPSAQRFTTGPIKLAYVTVPLTSDLTVSAGQIPSIEGWESTTDWHNANIIDSPLYYQESSASRGVSASYSHGPVSATVNFGDGWDTGVFNTFSALVSYSFNKHNSLSLYGEVNVSRTGPTVTPDSYGQYANIANYGAYYPNSNMIGGYYDFQHGNLSLVPEVQYVYAKVDHKIGLNKFGANFGTELLADYQFGKTPYSLGSMLFYYTNIGPEPWYLNPHSAAIGFGVTPTYQKGNFYVRAEAALLHMTRLGTPTSNTPGGFGSDGRSRNQGMGLLEAGFMF